MWSQNMTIFALLFLFVSTTACTTVQAVKTSRDDNTFWFAALLSQTSAVVSISVIAQLPSPVCSTTPTFNFRPSGLLCCSVAARRCLPPGANVCVAAPPIRSVLQSEYFCRISDMGCEPTGSPLFSPLQVSPFISHPFSSPPLELGPFRSS